MQSFRHILVPFDGSLSSLRACDEAAELAGTIGAKLTLLQVLEPSPYFLARTVTDELRTTTLRDLEARAAKLQAHTTMVQARVEEGLPGEKIVQIANELPADLIVMGTHGRGGLSHAILGSVAERVVRQSPVPVLTVREQIFTNRAEATDRLARLLRPLDLESAAVVALSRGALPIASTLARTLHGTLDLWLTTPIVLADGAVIGAMGEDERVALEPAASFGRHEIDPVELREAKGLARAALRRELEALRGSRSIGPTGNRPIVVVSDGFISAGPAIVAAEALRLLGPRALVLATPIATRESLAAALGHFDHVVCLKSTIVGERLAWYREPALPSNRQARALLEEASPVSSDGDRAALMS